MATDEDVEVFHLAAGFQPTVQAYDDAILLGLGLPKRPDLTPVGNGVDYDLRRDAQGGQVGGWILRRK